jgi:SAM-dependent methyltransferase
MSPVDPDEVTRFYDRHPYPPPIADLTRQAADWSNGRRQRVEHYRMWPAVPYRDDHSILVAGCGTSQAARYAVRYPRACVVGIDVSATAIEATRELAERHSLGNLELRQLPIEEANELERFFDQIVCTGVLHHLADPDVGLAALRSVLAPSGAMSLMLYAPYGRTGVSMIHEYCRLLGVRAEPGEVDELVAVLRELPLGHPLSHLLRNTPDFQDRDALADALLNPRERSYSVPQVLSYVENAGMHFSRWVRQAPYLSHCGVLRGSPHGRRIAALPVAEQFEAMELFRGTMTRHSFIACHPAAVVDEVRFDSRPWQDFVPIRTSSAVSVDHNLPDGAAGALLNRAHTYADLVLFVDRDEKRIFEAIDGHRSIGEIDDAHPDFFQRLWWHDLVVIDTSATAG